MNYQEFLKQKEFTLQNFGFDVEDESLNPMLFDFQKAIVKWALKRGKSAIFADCGLGKTPMQLEWANQICKFRKGKVLILAPLAVSHQTKQEGVKFGIEVNIIEKQEDVKAGINITNYEKIHKFDVSIFDGVVLDESSILKSFTGKTKNALIDLFQCTDFKLACSATPAPNDYMELGNHCEFLNVMSRNEMLSMFFINDASHTGDWRLKGHAADEFWRFIGTWAVMLQNPSDIGFSGDNFKLPELNTNVVLLEDKTERETLFSIPVEGLTEMRKSKKQTLEERCKKSAELANNSKEQWLIWCELNDESATLKAIIPDSVEVTGSDTDEHKEKAMLGFVKGEVRVLISKQKICGFGMNFQNCHNMIFCGLGYSYEGYYQATRRCWRYGQKNNVDVYVVLSEKEVSALESVQKKESDHKKMNDTIINTVKTYFTFNTLPKMYKTNIQTGDGFTAILGDSVEKIKEIADESVDYSIYSPPFSSLYTYSNSERDMGNSKNDEQFYEHFKFLAKDLYRILKSGRLMSVHCMQLPTKKFKDGYIGLKDFRGELIRLFEAVGFYYVSEVCIWKDPVVQMQRTKALNLLHKQLKKDSSKCSQGLADYILTFKKRGENQNPIKHTPEEFPVEVWQKYASPIWTDIKQSNTLQKQSAREEKDEKHICPLQLDVIERCLYLWSNPNDIVFSPFMGIGSEGYVSLKLGRKFIGIELKESYYNQAVGNLKAATQLQKQLTIPL